MIYTRTRFTSDCGVKMPHVSFVCPDPEMWTYDEASDEFTRSVPVAQCLGCSLSRPDRVCNWDYPDLKMRVQRDVSKSYTPSKMNGCDLEQWLKLRHEYTVDPESVSRMAGGTNSHAGLETDIEDIYSEVTVCRDLVDPDDGYVYPIVVRPDKVYVKLGIIHDDKTRAYLPQQDKRVVVPDITDDVRRQLSIGAWAWAAPKWVDFGDGTRREHAGLDVNSGQVMFRQADFTKQVRVGVDLLVGQTLYSFMLERCRELRRMYEGERPQPIQDADAMWRCENCPVRSFCDVDFDKRVKLKQARAKAARTRRGS